MKIEGKENGRALGVTIDDGSRRIRIANLHLTPNASRPWKCRVLKAVTDYVRGADAEVRSLGILVGDFKFTDTGEGWLDFHGNLRPASNWCSRFFENLVQDFTQII